MKIAHVATLVSPDGAYGGPIRVSVNQLTELQAKGHSVRLFASHRGYPAVPREMSGVPLTARPAWQVVPGIGFAGLTSPRLLAVLRRELPNYDVVHVHLARDLITLPSARMAVALGLPVILQTHGMIDASSRLLSVPLDAAMTRPVFRRAARTLYLTERERGDLLQVSHGAVNLAPLPNGVPVPDVASEPKPGDPLEVLFLARLQARKRPTAFVEAARRLGPEFPNVTFTLVGPDEGEGPKVESIIADAGIPTIRWEGALEPDRTLERMRRASIYVLPSVDEPFPMTVLEAASCGLPCIVTDTCGLAPAIDRWGAGVVVDSSVEKLVGAIRGLLTSGQARQDSARRARAMVEEEFGISAIARSLEGIYADAAGAQLGHGARA